MYYIMDLLPFQYPAAPLREASLFQKGLPYTDFFGILKKKMKPGARFLPQ